MSLGKWQKEFALHHPNRLRQSHFLHMHRARPRENSVNDPHHNSTDKKCEGHYPEIFQVFADLFRKCPRWDRGYDKRD